MKARKVFRNIILFLFLIFIAIYLSAQAGIIDYQARQKTLMTEEAIKEFEKDLKEGKEVNIKKYTKNKRIKYDNMLSRGTLEVSNSIGRGLEGILKIFFKKIEKAMNN